MPDKPSKQTETQLLVLMLEMCHIQNGVKSRIPKLISWAINKNQMLLPKSDVSHLYNHLDSTSLVLIFKNRDVDSWQSCDDL